MAHRTPMASTVVAPPPDDSDFLESEDEQSVVGRHDANELTEIEAELAAVATPATSQITSASAFQRMHPTPAGKIMQMTHNFSFTYFRSPAPRAETLNRNRGREAAGLPIDVNAPTRFTTKVNADGSTQSEPLPASSIAPHIPESATVHWFCIDSELVYLSFFEDWGPLNVAMFYRFCLHLHHLINSAQEESTASIDDPNELHLILYTSGDAKSKANAALLAAMYAMVCGDVSPADAYYPLNSLELLPFRDAGYGRADFYLTVQDVLYGVNRAINEGLLDLMTFDLEEYETFEQVQNGDWNWITPNIIAFASPNDKEYVAELRDRANGSGRPTTPGLRRPMNATFLRTVQYFKQRNVKLVVRLNNPLYDSRVFEREGIEHVDMYFDDGSNPCEEIVRDFIARADEVISQGGVVAVHCKAGLGRTGVLIGAYLAYKHGFSAGESIGFMRIMRPGCVVGPQQHFMYQQVSNWIRWREQDEAKAHLERALAKQRTELIGKRRLSDEVAEWSGTDDATAESEVEASLGGQSEQLRDTKRQIKKLKKSNELPTTPRRRRDDAEEEERRDDTIRFAKPTPCVGQPRKSPSPSRKRAAQAQAPATIARMGSTGATLAEMRGRVVSDSSVRSHHSGGDLKSKASSSKDPAGSSLGAALATSDSSSKAKDFIVRAEVHLDEDVMLGEQRRIQEQSDNQSRGHERNSSKEMHVHMNVDVEVSVAEREESGAATQQRQAIPATATNQGDDDGLFVEGWRSPEPPSTYMQRMTQSSPERGGNQVSIPAPSTPTSPSTPIASSHSGQRASPLIRERFGLRDTGLNQNTPRSRKEARGSPVTSSLTTSEYSVPHAGSSGSVSSDGSLTSRDAAGSADELTPTLQPGPLESLIVSEQKQNSHAPTMAQSPVKAQPSVGRTYSSSRDARGARVASNSSATFSSSTSRRNGTTAASSASRPGTSMSVRQANGSAASAPSGSRNGVPSTSTNGTVARRHASSAANSAGRVAAARERLAQKQQQQQPQQPKPTLNVASNAKRQRTEGAVASAAPSQSSIVAARAAASGRPALTRPALGSAPSSAVNGTARQPSDGVPRFAMSTAASAAKSSVPQAAQGNNHNFGSKDTMHSKTIASGGGVQMIANRFGNTYGRSQHSGARLPTASNAASLATLARLHGRNVHRRRSSLGETDIVM